MEPVIAFLKENPGMGVVALVILIPLAIVFQKKAAPVIFHTIEYVLYVIIAHYFIHATVKVIAWYKSQTPDVNDITAAPYTSPRNPVTENFFDKELYNPTGLLYFEALVAVAILYIVIVVRPTSYSASNKYKGDKERGMAPKNAAEKRKARYNRGKATSNRARK